MIHSFVVTAAGLKPLNIHDWWALALPDLERMTKLLLGERPGREWVRRGDHFVVCANRELGALATKLDTELSALAVETKKILAASGPDAGLRAAACYHLRFEKIHPLGEGNGRIGRTILAAQLHQACRIPPEELLAALYAQENDYKAVFASGQPPIMFELMLDLLAQLTGQVIAEESTKLPFSILPLHPDRRVLVKGASQQKRPPPPGRPPQQNPFFRKFR